MTDFKTPRIKIVQGWPGMNTGLIGAIYDVTEEGYVLSGTVGTYSEFSHSDTIDFPVHFRQLLWHEERTDEELAAVKYVKVNYDSHRAESVPYFAKVKTFHTGGIFIEASTANNECGYIGYKNCEPCTEQDYLTALK